MRDKLGDEMEKYRQPIFKFFYRSFGNAATAEDLTQDVFVRMWMSRANIKTTQTLLAYMMKTARNLYIDKGRKQKPEVLSLDDPFYDGNLLVDLIADNDAANPEKHLDRTLFYEELLDNLAGCSELRRQIFLRMDVDGLSQEETAELLGVKKGTVKSSLHRTRRIIRANYERSRNA